MTSAAVVLPHPNSPGAPGTSPVKIDTPSVRPPSPSAPPAMFGSAAPMYDRRDSGESEKDEHGRSRSTPMNRPISPAPKRTYSTGNLPAFTPSAILSPPSFHATNHRNSSPESRRTRSSENIHQNYSSPESSPQQHMVGLGGSHYQNGGLGLMSMRPSEHHNYANQDYDVMMRPKKRHKTSRACDECRRKKIRCDATSEVNVEQCSSCKRAGVNCSFSRVPMKRGPTKGLEAQYIRELEDRLVSLEYSVQTKAHVGREHSPPPERRFSEYNGVRTPPPQIFKQPVAHQSEPVKLNPVLGHSRSHLDRLPPIEAIHASPPIPTEKRHSQDYLRHSHSSYHPPSHRHEQLPPHHYHPNHEHHAPPDRRNSTDQSRKMSFSGHTPHERASSFNEAVARRPSSISHEKPIMNGAVLIDDIALSRYYEVYHQALPILPHSLKRLHSYLTAAPLYLRNALLHAIYALTCVNPPVSPSSPHPPSNMAHIDHTRKACDLLGQEAFVSDTSIAMSLSSNLLHMQTLLLLAINADKRAFAPPQSDTPPQIPSPPLPEQGYTSRFVGSMIGAAWGCANDMKLCESNGMIRKRTHDQMDGNADVTDVDGEECLSRRAWWILVILDRWRAVSTSSMPLISDDKICLKENDRHVLGEVGYHFVRLSCVLGHIAEVPHSMMSDMPLNLGQLGRLLNGEVERVRETAEAALNHDALLSLAFWHTKLLVVSHTSDIYQSPSNTYRGLLAAAKKVVDLIHARHFNPNTPFIHHIIGFATVVLVRLTSIVDTRDEAHKILHDLIAERKSSQFDPERNLAVEGYDIIAKKFLDHNHTRRHSEAQHIHHNVRRESESHYNDSNGIGRLAHLADLAVGEGSDREFSERQYHKKSDVWRSIGGDEGLDSLVKRQGYLSALQILLQS